MSDGLKRCDGDGMVDRKRTTTCQKIQDVHRSKIIFLNGSTVRLKQFLNLIHH